MSKKILLLLMAIGLFHQPADAAVDANALRARIQYRLNLYAANGQLSQRQAGSLRQRLDLLAKRLDAAQTNSQRRNVPVQRGAVSSDQTEVLPALQALDHDIDVQRERGRQTASSFFHWW